MTKNRNITKARATMFFEGGIHGLYIGKALSIIADMDMWKDPGAFLSFCGSVIGECLGFESVDKFNLSVGRGNTIMIIGDFVGLSTTGTLLLLDNWEKPNFNIKHYLLMSIAGFGSGLWLGAKVTRNIELFNGAPQIFYYCAIDGCLLPPLALSWANVKSGKMFIGGLAGALTGARLVFLTRFKDERALYTGLLFGHILVKLPVLPLLKQENPLNIQVYASSYRFF